MEPGRWEPQSDRQCSRILTMKRQEAVMTAGVRRVVPLTFGWENLPETVSIHGGDPTRRLREPVPGVLLELDGGLMLRDTGFNIPLRRDPRLSRRFHGRDHDLRVEPLPDDRDSLEVAFEL